MSMENRVDLPNCSPRKDQAIIAVKNGMQQRVKVVAATVVFVIACKNAILVKAKSIEANTPCDPISLSFLEAFLPYRKSKTTDIVIAKANDL